MNRVIAMLVLGVAAAATPAAGGDEIYKTTDEDGNVVYTDEPPSEDAEPVELEPLTTMPAPKEPAAPETASDDAAADRDQEARAAATVPEGIRIAYPPADNPVRHNGGNVPFRVRLQPEGAQLPAGHRVQIVVDGELRASGTGEQIVVSAVSRGPHTARARLVDAEGQRRLTSAPVKFYLLRKALGERATQGQQSQQGPQPQPGQRPQSGTGP